MVQANLNPYFQFPPFLLSPLIRRITVTGASPTRIPFLCASTINSEVWYWSW